MKSKYSSLFNTYVFKIQIKLLYSLPPTSYTHTHTQTLFNLLGLKDDDIYNQCALPVCTVKAKISAEGWCNVVAEQCDQNTRWSIGGKAKKCVCAWSLHKSP